MNQELSSGSLPNQQLKAADDISCVGVVGAGAMGCGIAQVCAQSGRSVLLFDAANGAVQRALEAIRDELNEATEKGRISARDADEVLGRIQAASSLASLAECPVIVEAIVERLDSKRDLMRLLEAMVPASCILATNTSSLSVTEIATACEHPERVVGWHFFNPVPKMRVVEVVKAARTSGDVVEKMRALSEDIGLQPIVTDDSPGFVVNHAGRAFVTEGLKLLAEHTADHQVLDSILRYCAGFRMGPFQLLDLTGLDVSVPVMEAIHSQYYGDDRYRPVALARRRMVAGLLGRKSGEGFYRYPTDEAPPFARAAEAREVKAWWADSGRLALPSSISSLLSTKAKWEQEAEADVVLVAPIGCDLSTALSDVPELDRSRTIAVDPIFGGRGGVTLMTSPATRSSARKAAEALFAAHSLPTYVIADSPGYVAPRVVACIVNLACEMAQQGIAAPREIDLAVKLALGYPRGPLQWGDELGADVVLKILMGLFSTFGDQRYRPSPWLERRARLGLSLATPDLAL